MRVVLGLPDQTPLQDWVSRTKQLCGSDLRTLKNRTDIAAVVKQKDLPSLCWKSLWCFATLSHGFRFPLDTTQISFALNAGAEENDVSSDLGWAGGSMLYEVNFFPWQIPFGMFEGPFYWALGFAILMLAIVLILIVQVIYLRKMLQLQDEDWSLLASGAPPTSQAEGP